MVTFIFSFFFNLVEKNVLRVDKCSKCCKNGIACLGKGKLCSCNSDVIYHKVVVSSMQLWVGTSQSVIFYPYFPVLRRLHYCDGFGGLPAAKALWCYVTKLLRPV